MSMTANTQKLDTVPAPRWLLMKHLDSIAERRPEHQEIVAQHRRLQAFVKAEADAQARVDALKQRDVRELAEQLVNPAGLHITVDHCDQSDAELDLARARREADVARACEPAVIERITVSSRQAAALEQRTILLVTDVMIDEGAALVAEINADAKRLRAKYARLWGLRRHMGDTPPIRKRLDGLPLPTHPDHIAPDPGELMATAEAWRGYAARLAADADAEFKE
jgi:hypothetical protein